MCLLSVAPCASVRVVEPTDDAVAAFERHLRSERGRSEHTRRAYLGDVRASWPSRRSAASAICGTCGSRTCAPGWLSCRTGGPRGRPSLVGRRPPEPSCAGRTTRAGSTATRRCGSSRHAGPGRCRACSGRTRLRGLLDVAAVAADDDDPVHLRDRAVLELLYASGIRVGELVGLDVDDVDFGADVVTVMGKGAKERSVPFGRPARVALTAWLEGGRPRLAAAESGPALFLGRRGRRVDPRQVRSAVHAMLAHVARRPRPGAARPAAQRRDAPARGRRGPAHRPGDARPRQPGDHADLHPRVRRAPADSPTSRRTPVPESPRAVCTSDRHATSPATWSTRSTTRSGTGRGACTGPVLSQRSPSPAGHGPADLDAAGVQRWPFPFGA